ncbi:MAG: hypothetical protein ABFS41_07115, partial [Myxococcota bacterium]
FRNRRGDPVCTARAVDPDAADDLVCSFPGEVLGGLAGVLLDRRVCLTGETTGGVPFKGCDSFAIRR